MDVYRYDRRTFLKQCGLLAGVGFLSTRPALAALAAGKERRLKFHNLHTGENIDIAYHDGHRYDGAALKKLDWFFRDHRQGKAMQMDPQLYDLLHALDLKLGNDKPMHLICGYRSPETNELLRRTRGGGVSKNSLHLRGMAADIRIPGISSRKIRDAAIGMQKGGVGFYPKSDFVHVDTGRPRFW